MERIDAGQPFLAVVDYSHKPAAVDGALRALRPLTRGRLIVVLGCGGDRDRGKRPHMGEIAARGADLLVVTDDNPRSEDPAAIRRAMLDGALAVPPGERGEVVEVGGRADAVAAAVAAARAGDTVLVRRQGPRDRAGDRRRRAPLRRPAAVARGDRVGRSRPVIELTLAEIAEIVGGRLTRADPAATVTGSVEFDSREVTRGGLFLALPGERVDGHDYVAAALASGAVAALVTRPVDGPAIEVDDGVAALAALAAHVVRRLPGLTVIGVTGSSGKTSTKDLLAQLLAQHGPTVAPPGSFNNELGHPYTVLRATTKTRFLVLETSARGIGHIAYLTGIAPPRIGVVLNVGSAHLGEFGSREAIARGEGRAGRGAAARRRRRAQRRRPAGAPRWPLAPRPGWCRSGESAVADVRAADVASRRPRPGVLPACHAAGRGRGEPAARRRASRRQRPGRGGGRARVRRVGGRRLRPR